MPTSHEGRAQRHVPGIEGERAFRVISGGLPVSAEPIDGNNRFQLGRHLRRFPRFVPGRSLLCRFASCLWHRPQLYCTCRGQVQALKLSEPRDSRKVLAGFRFLRPHPRHRHRHALHLAPRSPLRPRRPPSARAIAKPGAKAFDGGRVPPAKAAGGPGGQPGLPVRATQILNKPITPLHNPLISQHSRMSRAGTSRPLTPPPPRPRSPAPSPRSAPHPSRRRD